jgi:hypothetical protein
MKEIFYFNYSVLPSATQIILIKRNKKSITKCLHLLMILLGLVSYTLDRRERKEKVKKTNCWILVNLFLLNYFGYQEAVCFFNIIKLPQDVTTSAFNENLMISNKKSPGRRFFFFITLTADILSPLNVRTKITSVISNKSSEFNQRRTQANSCPFHADCTIDCFG